MRIIKAKPPIYKEIISAGMHPHQGVIYTYGDIIYNPSSVEIPLYVLRHEEKHSDQQGNDPDKWWSRYLKDKNFRIEQEAEAYAEQYKFICKTVKDRNYRTRMLTQLAGSLSGPVYGNVIGSQKAFEMIKSKANVK